MVNHRSKPANIRRFYLAHNTLLGLNELTYSWPMTYCHWFHINNYLCRASKSKRRCCNLSYEIWKKSNEHHGSVKLYTVVRLGKRWTVLVGSELVDVQEQWLTCTKTFTMGTAYFNSFSPISVLWARYNPLIFAVFERWLSLTHQF
jgi:hypothetical protein